MITCAQKYAVILGERKFDPSVMAWQKEKKIEGLDRIYKGL